MAKPFLEVKITYPNFNQSWGQRVNNDIIFDKNSLILADPNVLQNPPSFFVYNITFVALFPAFDSSWMQL